MKKKNKILLSAILTAFLIMNMGITMASHAIFVEPYKYLEKRIQSYIIGLGFVFVFYFYSVYQNKIKQKNDKESFMYWVTVILVFGVLCWLFSLDGLRIFFECLPPVALLCIAKKYPKVFLGVGIVYYSVLPIIFSRVQQECFFKYKVKLSAVLELALIFIVLITLIMAISKKDNAEDNKEKNLFIIRTFTIVLMTFLGCYINSFTLYDSTNEILNLVFLIVICLTITWLFNTLLHLIIERKSLSIEEKKKMKRKSFVLIIVLGIFLLGDSLLSVAYPRTYTSLIEKACYSIEKLFHRSLIVPNF